MIFQKQALDVTSEAKHICESKLKESINHKDITNSWDGPTLEFQGRSNNRLQVAQKAINYH